MSKHVYKTANSNTSNLYYRGISVLGCESDSCLFSIPYRSCLTLKLPFLNYTLKVE